MLTHSTFMIKQPLLRAKPNYKQIPLAKVFQNTYGRPIRLIVAGGGEIISMKGTCQEGLCAMALYAVATIPLIRNLQESNPNVTQAWYVDDDTAGGAIRDLFHYWTDILDIGPGYGPPQLEKTVLLVKPDHESEDRRVFADTAVMIRTDGNRHLGGSVRNDDFSRSHADHLVAAWLKDLESLISMADSQFRHLLPY